MQRELDVLIVKRVLCLLGSSLSLLNFIHPNDQRQRPSSSQQSTDFEIGFPSSQIIHQ
jgi:hypothetical protein